MNCSQPFRNHLVNEILINLYEKLIIMHDVRNMSCVTQQSIGFVVAGIEQKFMTMFKHALK